MELKDMKKNLSNALLSTALLFSCVTIHAAIIEVNYEGTVYLTYDHAQGNNLGDTVSGSLFIDTDLAPADRYSSSLRSLYLTPGAGNSGYAYNHLWVQAYDNVLGFIDGDDLDQFEERFAHNKKI
jgi:hypothetical protein